MTESEWDAENREKCRAVQAGELSCELCSEPAVDMAIDRIAMPIDQLIDDRSIIEVFENLRAVTKMKACPDRVWGPINLGNVYCREHMRESEFTDLDGRILTLRQAMGKE
jgi:hypothetical protein